MVEIGGYFGLESHGEGFPHDDGICFNSCCSALRYLIRTEGIVRLHVPRYTCGSVHVAVEKENCEIVPYDLGADWFPAKTLPQDEFILFNNYFGVSGQRVRIMAERHRRLIVDAAQAFFSKPCGYATLYSPRKFVGVPDGGILCGIHLQHRQLDQGTSWHKAMHLLKRTDVCGSFGYADFLANEEKTADEPILGMSRLTYTMMGNIDYKFVAERRFANFSYLREHLPTTFPVSLSSDDVPMVYPYMTDDPRLRMRLISAKIYIPTYWPGVRNCTSLPERILPLPIDQRYADEDMKRIVEAVRS